MPLPSILTAVRRLRSEAKERRISRRTRRSPDRVLLVERILPAFAAQGGRILWIGCRRYTDDYAGLLEAQGAECWTTDIDPQAATFGHPERHRTGDMTALPALFPGLRFDAILCNGVFGYGVDSPAQQVAAAASMAAVAADGARLVLGWNTDKIADPVAAGVFASTFDPAPAAGLPQRIEVEASTHVYDLMLRR